MAFRQNQFFNNPQFGAAAANLSALFAPPSGADAANWATAGAAREEAARLAQFFQTAQDPNADWSTLDRLGIGAGVFNPSQSFRAVDQSNATQRYGYDRTFDASTQNNIRDNARALQERELMEAATTQRQMAEPLILDENQAAFLPAQTQAATGLDPRLSGNINVGQDELTQTIMGETIAGPRSPLSETQWNAAQNERLRQTGALTDDMLIDTIIGARTPVEAIGADGPVFMSPGAAVRTAARPYDAPSSGSVKMYQTSSGQRGRTTDGMTDLVTGEPIPADAMVGSVSDTSETFGDSEISKARGNLLTRRAGLESMPRQVATLDEQLARADAAQAIGIVGSSTRILNDLATQAGATLDALGVTAPDSLRDVQRYQNSFRAMGVQNAELQSGLLDLAYATAQSREPGRLTEADIDRALRTIGGNLQDPIAMRQVLRGAVDRATMDYRATEDTFMDAYGDALNLRPAEFPELPPMAPPVQPEDRRDATGVPGGNSQPATIETQGGAVTIRRID